MLKLKQIEDFRKNNQEIFKNYNQDIKYVTKIQMKKQFREGASRTNKEAIKAGIIKKEVHEVLKKRKDVESFKLAVNNLGATIITLKR